MVKFTPTTMPEVLVQQDQGGHVVKLTNSASTGYRVYIEHPDGTAEYQKVSSPQAGRGVMGNIVDGEFNKYCSEHHDLYPWEGECSRCVEDKKKTKRRR